MEDESFTINILLGVWNNQVKPLTSVLVPAIRERHSLEIQLGYQFVCDFLAKAFRKGHNFSTWSITLHGAYSLKLILKNNFTSNKYTQLFSDGIKALRSSGKLKKISGPTFIYRVGRWTQGSTCHEPIWKINRVNRVLRIMNYISAVFNWH